MQVKSVLSELKEIEARVSGLVQRMEAEDGAITATVCEVRKYAILEEVFRNGERATPEEISDFAKKYGKTPSSTAGYYSGKNPSLTKSVGDDKIRQLTETGKEMVLEARNKWGADWLDRVPLDLIGSNQTPNAAISF